jgi:hypothetical protein
MKFPAIRRISPRKEIVKSIQQMPPQLSYRYDKLRAEKRGAQTEILDRSKISARAENSRACGRFCLRKQIVCARRHLPTHGERADVGAFAAICDLFAYVQNVVAPRQLPPGWPDRDREMLGLRARVKRSARADNRPADATYSQFVMLT